ncbi:hypothetical protein AGMMS50230_16490 [Spirochaetia bacterium]|nr:hypothetical protein AGMMS50230_16490 [Spirochaetia bacterium]
MANTPEEFPVFTDLDMRQITILSSRFRLYLKDFEINNGLSGIIASPPVIAEICERIEKRRIYFHIFYNCKMGELNEGSLMCFWILKLMPFSHLSIPLNELNAKIALYLLNNVLIYHAKKKGKKVNISSELYERLYYSFRFRDISKEAIMALSESLIIQ